MKRRSGFAVPPLLAVLVFLQCKSDSTGPVEDPSCVGPGSQVAFCKQVDHYEAGFGVPGQDYIVATCLREPAGATVSNTMNGTYSCTGSYKLTTFNTAEIDLNWGGSTSYSSYESHQITAPGTGQFTVQVTKISGGSGNVSLTMSSGSSWMFNTVLVNVDCTTPAPGPGARVVAPPAASLSVPEPARERPIHVRSPRAYGPAGELLDDQEG
jgi:hypothetical protein